MKKVDLLIIGAGRAGTTSIYQYLTFHPEICFSKVKEIHYFSIEDLYKRGINYYHSFFDYKAENKIITAADTYLFVDKKAPKRIQKYNPEMKFLVMLRNPVERAYSGYNYAINNGYLNKNIDFKEASENEHKIIEKSKIQDINNLCNIYQSKYYEHLKYWMNYFPIENFLLLKTNELKNQETVLKEISNFLKISNFPKDISDIKTNTASTVKSKKIQQILLDRDRGIRKLVRIIFPQKLKNKIMNSGIIGKIYKINRTEASYTPLSQNEKLKFQKYFVLILK